MRLTGFPISILACFTLLLALLISPTWAFAHCDGMDGPVVQAARKALETGNPNLILIWVQEKDEAEVRNAFERTVKVRKLGPEAAALADIYFFETVVRLHRAGEGAPYTGLKPAGRDLGPAIPAADRALQSGSEEALVKLITVALQDRLQEHFKDAVAKKDFSKDNIEGGRAYVKAYVGYIHYVERIYEAVKNPSAGHYHEGE